MIQKSSIVTYHDPKVKLAIDGQRIRVAREIIRQTKKGNPSCMGSLWQHFNHTGDTELSQKSSVSRACREIALLCEVEGYIEVDGVKYKRVEVAPKKFLKRVVNHFCLVLLSDGGQTGQIEMF